MNNPLSEFIDKAKGITRNPLGIIALFVSLIYGFACLVLSTSLNNLEGQQERLPLIWFIILFPSVILGAFMFLVVYHHKKLYAPSDYKDENNFINSFIGPKEVPSGLAKAINQLKYVTSEESPFKGKGNEHLIASISGISDEIEKIKEKTELIPINNLWKLNHWGSNCASIVGDNMIFTGTSAPIGVDGSHINLNNVLEIGKIYEISCFAKSDINTNGKFQLWVHDETGAMQYRVSASSAFETPANEGETVKIKFRADFNKNIRVHLQYKPGEGRIEISDVKISEVVV